MQKSVVFIKDQSTFVGTWDLSMGFDHPHPYLKKIIEKYKDEFSKLGFVGFKNTRMTGKKGGQIEEYYLNEQQSIFLMTLVRNNEKTVRFKRQLSDEFTHQRKLIMNMSLHLQNPEWLQKREEGKIERNNETDVIKLFVEYATNQGSKSAKMYYMNITKMKNDALFCLEYLGQKFDNLRDVLNTRSLNTLLCADMIVSKALKEGMDKMMNYKDIYQYAKDKILNFASCIGRTPIEIAMDDNLNKRLPIA